MRAMISLCAMLLMAVGIGCSRTDDSADRTAPPMDQTPAPMPDDTTPPSDPGTMPPADPSMPPPPGDETTPPTTPPPQ